MAFEPAWHLRGEPHGATRKPGRVVVERFAGGKDQTRDPLAAHLRDEQVRPAPVVLHQGHGAQVEALKELRHEVRKPAHRKVGAGAHRVAMPAQRQGGDDWGGVPGAASQLPDATRSRSGLDRHRPLQPT